MNSRLGLCRMIVAAALLSIFSPSARAETLSAADVKAVRERAALIGKAMDESDADTIVDMTHSSLHDLAGGKEKMREITRGAMKQIQEMKVRILESKLNDPGEAYVAGDELVCFLPRTSIVQVGDKRAKSIGFLIGVRKQAGGPWYFLDGASLRKNPQMLKQLLPDLPDDVKLPENRVALE